ncbi:MAG TPA: transposase [Thermodesulfovibrionales bacterium]|nr:transposase [Thermodesulfovibrionales bacterium]
MPRIARAIAVDFPHHIVQRGNNRENVFLSKKDREKYLDLLKKYSEKWDVPVLAYCLMSNHVHLLARPKNEMALYKMMQGLTLCYTQHINRTYNRTGRLWESRYHSCIVDKERYLWAVARYIEQNAVRAKMVKRVEEYPYSSARAHMTGKRDEILGEELFEKGQRKDYREILRSRVSDAEMEGIRYSTKTGRPFGGVRFIETMEKKLRMRFILKSPGRPKKEKGK